MKAPLHDGKQSFKRRRFTLRPWNLFFISDEEFKLFTSGKWSQKLDRSTIWEGGVAWNVALFGSSLCWASPVRFVYVNTAIERNVTITQNRKRSFFESLIDYFKGRTRLKGKCSCTISRANLRRVLYAGQVPSSGHYSYRAAVDGITCLALFGPIALFSFSCKELFTWKWILWIIWILYMNINVVCG